MNINSLIISGKRTLDDISYLLQGTQHVLLVTDKNIVNLEGVRQLLEQVTRTVPNVTLIDNVPPEPSQHDVAGILQTLEGHQPDLIIGVGGGSVLDVAKLLSLICVNDERITLTTLLEGEKPQRRSASLLIPTTAGTGSEATPNAILAIPEKETKVGIISPVMLPDYVALVPELTTSIPKPIAASTGIDALCHLIECFTATIANPVGDNYALIGMKKLFASIDSMVNDPSDLQARLNMLWASYYGGAAIAHAGTHLVHAMSYPLGGKFHIPHGVANAILLVPCMKFIRPQVVAKFAQVYDLLPKADRSLSDEEKSHQLVAYLEALVIRLGLPTTLTELDISADHLPLLSRSAIEVQRLIKNVPVSVTEEDVYAIYQSIC